MVGSKAINTFALFAGGWFLSDNQIGPGPTTLLLQMWKVCAGRLLDAKEPVERMHSARTLLATIRTQSFRDLMSAGSLCHEFKGTRGRRLEHPRRNSRKPCRNRSSCVKR